MKIDYTNKNRDHTIEGNNNDKQPEGITDQLLKGDNLTIEQYLQLRNFIIEFSDTFYDSNQPIRTTR